MALKKNILVITQWSFQDALIQVYTLPYVRMMRKNIDPKSRIILVTFEQAHIKLSPAEAKEVQKKLFSEGIEWLACDYAKPTAGGIIKMVGSMFNIWRTIKKEKIDILHAWCTPAGSMAYLLSKFSGRPLVIDSYEPHSEAMVENQTWKRNGFKHHILFYFEKKLSKHASVIISATEGMKQYALNKYQLAIKNFFVKPACVDLTKFNLSLHKDEKLLNEMGLTNKIVAVYAGKFGGIYLTNEVFDFFKQAENKWGDQFRALILTGHSKNEIEKWADEAGFDKKKMIVRSVFHDGIEKLIALGDFGLTPVKPIPTKRYCTPIKDGEYWGLGLPVVITANISDDSDIIEQNNIGAVWKSQTIGEYQAALVKIEQLLKDPQAAARANSIAKKYRSFDIAENVYKEVYGSDQFFN
jgi:glycosyltransferase involved in cell wall biosynthesis